MAGPSYGSQAAVQAINVAFEITTAVEAEIYRVEYPEHDWRNVVQQDQIVENINVGAQNYAYMIRDIQGAAGFQSNIAGRNIPRVGTSLGAVTVPLAASAVGAVVTNEDARQFQMGMNANLATDLGEAMRTAMENLIETTVFFGDASVGFRAFLAYEGVYVGVVADTGEGDATEWDKKSGAQMVEDVNAALSYVYTESNTLFRPNIVLLPPKQFLQLSNTYMAVGGGSTTALAISALQYLLANNTYTALTGQKLEVRPIRYLKGAGVESSDRMVIMDRKKKNQFMPFPMPYKLQAPVPGPLSAEFYAEMKHGSFAVRQLGSMAYFDGI